MSTEEVANAPTVTLDDTAKKDTPRVWIQLAECGKFAGHPAGDFELSPQVFSQICANFKRDKLPIPIDMEHASEQAPTDGTIPVNGAPATGWIHSLDNRGPAGLWGEVEWLEPARSYIKEGKYRYLSPAIRFESRDRVTGQPIGARLTSAAITNQPFLRNMQPLVAASDRARTAVYRMSTSTPNKIEPGSEVTVHEPPAAEQPEIHARMAHHPSQYMNKVRACLGMHPMASAKECAERLEKLRDMHAEYGSKTPDGIDMTDTLASMRTLSGVGMAGTWENVFDLFEDMIDAAIDKHEIEDHGAGPQLSDKGKAKPEPEKPDEDEDSEDDSEDVENSDKPKTAKEAQATDKVSAHDTNTEAPGGQGTNTPEGINMADDDNKLVVALRDAHGQVSTLTLALKDAKHEAAVLKAENEHLKTLMRTQEEQALMNEVFVAFETYKDQKKLTLSQRDAMMSFAKADIAAFRAMYPTVPANQRYLMREVTPPAPKVNPDLTTDESGRPLDFSGLTQKLMSEKKLPFEVAQNEAVRLLRASGGR